MGDWFQILADVEASDCVLGAPLGHAPGSDYLAAVTERYPGLLELRANGVEVATKRTVFFDKESPSNAIPCPHCGKSAVWDDLADVIGVWWEGGVDTVPCVACHRAVGLNEGKWNPPAGFGYLGFKFWNWPPLRQEFIEDVEALLDHRLVYIRDKL